MGLFDNATQHGMQMLLKDNGNIKFRTLVIDKASLVEKRNNQVTRGWRHFHRLLYPFDGYKNIHPCMVTISHERDVVYDPHGVLADNEKPEKMLPGKSLFDREGIKEVAQETNYRHEQMKKPNTLQNKLTWLLLIMAFVWGMADAFMLVR